MDLATKLLAVSTITFDRCSLSPPCSWTSAVELHLPEAEHVRKPTGLRVRRPPEGWSD